ncbi:MAG TPA: HDIG domain-containing metalloprotein [Pseudobacteroides sp.]|uniref:HDIG domain-containing metalloprotein n=1 Tax=Pseudobacteroides sp. TaxID=1968840 RepID=UPI002F94FB67
MTSLHDIFRQMHIHLLNDEQPSLYFNEISKTRLFEQYPLNLLNNLKNAQQSPKHHPEGNVWVHTMMVVDEAAKVKNESNSRKAFMWAALLHDIGKPDATKNRNGKITSYDHDKIGANLARKFLMEFSDDEEFIRKVTILVRWHMQILFVVNNLPFADVKTMKRQANVTEVALLGLCDRMGRLNADRRKEEANIKAFLEKMGTASNGESRVLLKV